MAAPHRQPLDLDAHRGSRWSMHIRDGLVDAKHCAAMGDSIWLYLYLHKVCAQKTGFVKHYQHADAAAALGISVSTVKRQLPVLVAGDYITVTRGYNHLAIQITRYEWQEGRAAYRSDESTEVSEQDLHEEREVAELTLHSPNEVADMTRLSDATERLEAERSVNSDIEKCQNGLARSIYTNYINRDVVGGTDPEPPAASACADAPPHKETKRARARPAPKDKDAETERQAKALRDFQDMEPWVQEFCRLMAESLGWQTTQPATFLGWAVKIKPLLATESGDNRLRFGKWLFSNGYYASGAGHHITSALQSEHDTWVSAGRPLSKKVAKPPATAPTLGRSQVQAPVRSAAGAALDARIAALARADEDRLPT